MSQKIHICDKTDTIMWHTIGLISIVLL